ncbi:ATP-binding protein [Dyadobacter luticola]|uniref:histidine kinase n=1 Tax=Dyadobacter luticola TaxID=1979387 RepID=A0A5R9L1L5_9BACT|nr:ATP-binding protein [Dyadobacter luticola]TLV02249.1 response regulator [Dyadobacter luticola]
MKIRNLVIYITAGFIVGIIALVLAQYVTRTNVEELISGNESLLKEYRLSKELIGLQKDLLLLDNTIKTAATTGDSGKITDFEKDIAKIREDAETLKKSQVAARYTQNLDLLIGEKIMLSRQLVDSFYTAGKPLPEQFVARHRALRLSEQITTLTHQIDTTGRIALAEKLKSVDRSGQKVMNWNVYIIVLVLVLLSGVFVIIIQRMKKQAELINQLNTSEKKLKEAVLVKENFLANMSHEIRTPLNAILGYTDLLKKEKLEDEARLHLTTVHQSGETLLAIVNDILDLSKIESGMLRIEQVPFDVRNLVKSSVAMFRHKSDEKGVALHLDISPDIPETLIGDATRLTQILINLIGNAVKFTLKGQITVAVRAQNIDLDKIEAVFEIIDTGIGIEPGKLETIFERFRQAEDSTTRQFGGTGLGLSIVRDLVLLQNGDIDVHSKLGSGTSVTVIIPYQIGQVPVSKNSEHLPAKPLVLNDQKALIVEDNPINQGLMAKFMQEFSIKYAIAENGKEALQILQNETFDIILTDIQMPEMDGYTLTTQIRQTLKLGIPIIAMTANAMPGEREKCIGYGMNDHLPKPIREADLQRIFSEYLHIKSASHAHASHSNPTDFTIIDLGYMREISGGDEEYEKLVTSQFLDLVPAQLEALSAAFYHRNNPEIRHIAHNLKTTISIMGLDEKLFTELDSLENEELDEDRQEILIRKVALVCEEALAEARSFHSQFTP